MSPTTASGRGIALLYVRVVAGADRGDRCLDILGLRPLQVLRLKIVAGPSSGAGAVIAQQTAGSAISAAAREQRVDLLGGGLRHRSGAARARAGPVPAARRPASLSTCFLSRLATLQSCVLEPGLQARNLVHPGDGATSNFGELSIDLRSGSPGNSARRLQPARDRHRSRAH